jgi:hypothetical protein
MWRPDLVKRMSEIARRVVSQTTRNFPTILIGIGLITTMLWVSVVITFAFERAWSALSAL